MQSSFSLLLALTQSSSKTVFVRSISPSDSLSHSFVSIRVSLLESYQSEAADSSLKSSIASSYDINHRKPSTSSYQAASSFTHTKSTQSYTVYSQAFSVLSPSFTRPSSPCSQVTQGIMSFTMPLPAQSSRSAMLNTVSSENYLTPAASRFSFESILSTTSIQIDGDRTTLYRSVIVSPTINSESKIIIPSVNIENDQSVISTTQTARYPPTDLLPSATYQVLSTSIATSKGQLMHFAARNTIDMQIQKYRSVYTSITLIL